MITGISRPVYTEEQLQEMNRKSNTEKIDIDGKKYTRYECTQLQRQIETKIRKLKDRKEILKAAGDDVGVRECNRKIRLLKEKYNVITQKAGLDTHYDRMSVVKSGKTVDITAKIGIMKTSRKNGDLAIPYSNDIIDDVTKKYLSNLKSNGDFIKVDTPPSYSQMSLLSRQSGTEFASVSSGNRHYVIKGNKSGVTIPGWLLDDLKLSQGTLNCHSHPYIGDLVVSEADIKLAYQMSWQRDFYVISPDGKVAVYTSNGVNFIEDVKNEISEENKEFYKSLFEE